MDLSQLAVLLRENGDQVLNGVSKLSLSTKLLKDLNESFSLIVEERETLSSTFQVISVSNSKVELLLDLQFLHDFVQRTMGLKLIEDNSESCDLVSINKFKNLRLLELRKIPINQLTGLQALRTQLQYIICVRCLQNLKDLFITCGGDKSQGFIWSELKEAVLSYNNLETLDNSFEYVPWLQTLDLSHNSIVNAQAIDCLPNLKHLNIGFNHLESVPIFKKELFRNLQILILKSNYIGDLTGLLYLDNLVTLDLSCNCLVDHKTMSPLAHLAALQWLNLEGNPLSFHPEHRSITARYLHSNTATVKFILDRTLLSKTEIKLIGTYYPSSSKFIVQMRREHHTSVSSNISELTNSSDITQITQVATSELTRSQSIQRIKKVRDAVISEKDENSDIRDDKGEIVNPDLIKSINSVSSLNISTDLDHLETQKKIESLRDQYGEEWLKSQGGSMMQDILGIEKQESTMSSTPYEQDFMIHAAEIFNKPIVTAVNAVASLVVDSDRIDVTSEISANNTFVTANESFDIEDTDIQSERDSICSDEHGEEDEEEHPYLAQILQEGLDPEEIFIVLTNTYIKERDTLTARTKAKWLLEIISFCEITSRNPTTVHIEFDTVRRNMKQRKYILDEEEAEKLHREISNIISQKPLSARNQIVYCCMKCSTQFSQDKIISVKDSDNPHNLPKCPNPVCGSTLVYELDDESTPTNRFVLENNGCRPFQRAESPSECSIASETENNPVAQIHVTAEVHTNCNKAAAVTDNRSAASVQESSSSIISAEENQIENNIRKYESDIEIISNPSQSSIEVLDDQFRPGRKRSSEERKTIIAPTLGTIEDINISSTKIILQGLTESSSSSSFTESVCTAYDTQVHTSRPSSGLGLRPSNQEGSKEGDKNNSQDLKEEKNKSNIITSLFEGLFSSPTVGTKSEKSTTENDIEFNFTENFANVDHRIKYHLYQNIFEDEHENFVWLLKCVLISLNNQPFQCCIVLSTYRIYILNIKEHNASDELSTWLIKKESYTIDRLQTVFTLPWKQGIGLEIRGAAKNVFNYLCLLQDMQRTSNFLTFLASNPLPDSCDVECVAPEQPMLNLQHLLLSHYMNAVPKDSTLCLLSVFSKCTIKNNESKNLNLGVFLVTKTDLIILSDVSWLLPNAEKEPKIFVSQPISNLLEMDLEEFILDFHFLDEIAGCEEVWTIIFETVDSLNTAISAIKSPWEEIFLVPLQVNHKIHSI